jgi:Prokaryotic homologs of the JAB domain
MEPWLQEADRQSLSVVKVHSHPGGLADFSEQDDRSDADLFSCIDGWIEGDVPHISAIMLPDGRMFGRVVSPRNEFKRLRLIAVAGDNLFGLLPIEWVKTG